MCDKTTDKILSKISKLLTLSKDSGASDSEALAALQLAQQLMAKYGVEASDIDGIKEENKNIIEVRCEHKWDAGFRKPLASVISENYRCKCFLREAVVCFLGQQTDAQIAKQAFEFAYKFIYKRGNQEYEKVRKQGYSGASVFNSYAAGFLSGLKEILDAQSKALMIVVPDAVIDAYNAMTLANARGGMNTKNGVYSSIYESGRQDAIDHFSKPKLPESR